MFDLPLLTILLLTGFINLIGALAYAARIAGVRTGRIAMSFALFNILLLFSRTSNSFLGPFLAKRIETRIHDGTGATLFLDMQMVLAAASVATLIGILLVPTGQRLFAAAIDWYQDHRSTTRLAVKAVSPGGLATVRRSLRWPRLSHLRRWTMPPGMGWGILVANCLAQSLLAVGVVASLYAGYLAPEFRVTASQLSALINGFATILLFAFIDPQLSVMTDDAVHGSVGEGDFRRAIMLISLSRLAGTILAQLLLLPAAMLIALVAVHV
ncbi:lipid II flippase Amj family protein [Sphingopyxis sp. MWB1]|uniref:lipid II flippase Amj family protein n=1 Tax=Sphingopyxis sp. MWB1 TaxID=1537715 RepID=UPI00051A3FB5|nr:lipid II flippase Amj family protein [Sphingopyxis sp. MWB1]